MNDPAMLLCAASKWAGSDQRCRWCDGILPPNRKRWCSDRCVNTYGKNHWWTDARKAARRRDKYRCVRCGANKHGRLADGTERPAELRGLNVHHIAAAKGTHHRTHCSHHLANLETLCKVCHRVEHYGDRHIPPGEQLRVA